MFSFIDPPIHHLKSSVLCAEHVVLVEVLMNVADHEINQHIPALKLMVSFQRDPQYCRSITMEVSANLKH